LLFFSHAPPRCRVAPERTLGGTVASAGRAYRRPRHDNTTLGSLSQVDGQGSFSPPVSLGDAHNSFKFQLRWEASVPMGPLRLLLPIRSTRRWRARSAGARKCLAKQGHVSPRWWSLGRSASDVLMGPLVEGSVCWCQHMLGIVGPCRASPAGPKRVGYWPACLERTGMPWALRPGSTGPASAEGWNRGRIVRQQTKRIY
jgi:hypothetical protein